MGNIGAWHNPRLEDRLHGQMPVPMETGLWCTCLYLWGGELTDQIRPIRAYVDMTTRELN